MLRLLLATAIGWVIGRERKIHAGSGGGSRTMALICLSSCFLAVFSKELLLSGYTFDFSRLMAYLLPAIGFLGMSIVNRHDEKIDGLTTSATLLVLLPIGFAIGIGYYFYGIITSIIVYFILESKYILHKGENNE